MLHTILAVAGGIVLGVIALFVLFNILSAVLLGFGIDIEA